MKVKMSCQRSVKLPFLFLHVLTAALSFNLRSCAPCFIFSTFPSPSHRSVFPFYLSLIPHLSSLLFLITSLTDSSTSFTSYIPIFLQFSPHTSPSFSSPSHSYSFFIMIIFSKLSYLPFHPPLLSTYTLFLLASICGFLLFTKTLY